jgi:phosphopentomutase
MGLISDKPFPTYPNGFPEDIVDRFEKATEKKVLCNKPYSGTQVIKDYGLQHEKTGDLIVYTSSDSVFQIAAKEDIVPIKKLYEYCKIARSILVGEHAVGRVIARPFVGDHPDYTRTANRHDFSVVPPRNTALDYLKKEGYDVISIGKINDIFAGKGITRAIPTKSNTDGMDKTIELAKTSFNGLCFVNLVEFDSLYGHRNDVYGYTNALNDFDKRLGELIPLLSQDDILIITADHGCDPATESTDHSREYTPLLVYGNSVNPTDLNTRSSFADIGKTILHIFGIKNNLQGQSFLDDVLR